MVITNNNKMPCGVFGEPRLIHGPGFIQLCTDRSGDLSEWGFLSSGNDGDVWLWGKEELDDVDYTPRTAGGRTHNALAWHGHYAYVGHTHTNSETGIEACVVSKLDLEDTSSSSQLVSFSLDVTTVDVSPSGSFIAAGAVDHNVKIFNFNDETMIRIELDGPIFCVAIDPKEEFLAVSTSSGNLYTYRLPINSSSTAVGTSRLSPRIGDIDISRTRLQCAWSPDGEFLLAPSSGCVRKFLRDDFSVGVSLTDDKILDEMFSVCCVSPCGKYVAASSLSGMIAVWNILDGSLNTLSRYICKHGEQAVICSMVWSRALDATIFFADTNEHLCALSKCIKSITAEDKVSKVIVDDSDDNDTKLSEDLGAIKRAFGFGEDGTFIGETNSETEKNKPYEEDRKEQLLLQYKPPVLPSSFVSGATPVTLNERYLKWNRFGVITSYTTTSESSVEATWHDASVHSTMNIDNSSNYTMGDISNEVLVLASKRNNDDLSELYVIYIAAWSQLSREWTSTLNAGEVIEDVLIGANFVAVVTSARCFRTFSLSGTQTLVVSFPGVLATACAAGDELSLATYSGGCFFEEDYDSPQFNITINIYKVGSRNWFKSPRICETVPAVTGRGSRLVWMGYSREGEICTLDSKYCFRLLTRNRIWIPVHDFSSSLKSKSDGIWPIGVIERPKLEIRYVYCKGTNFPLIPTKPIPLIAECKIPLCSPESEKSKLENDFMLTEIVRSTYENGKVNYSSEVQDLASKYTKDLVRLFALSCKADRECRAEEFAQLASAPQILQSLCNFAAKTRHGLLSEKVADIGRQCSEDLINDSVKLMNPPHATSSHKLNLKLSKRSGRKSTAEADAPLLNKGTLEEDNGVHAGEANTATFSERSSPCDVTLASENSTQLALDKIKPPNPFKRKTNSVLSESTENTFDDLSLPVNESSSTPVNKAKRTKQTQPSSKQSTLPFSAEKKPSEKKTGFALWLGSCEDDLRKEYDGEGDGFMAFAIKKFRSLSSFEKQRWNDAAE